MIDREKITCALSLIYAQEILRIRPEDMDSIPEMNNLLLKSFHNAKNYFNSLPEEEFESVT